jgi:hypothetical protein
MNVRRTPNSGAIEAAPSSDMDGSGGRLLIRQQAHPRLGTSTRMHAALDILGGVIHAAK